MNLNPIEGGSARVIRIDGTSMRDGTPEDGSGAIDDVVKAIIGALEDGQLGGGSDKYVRPAEGSVFFFLLSLSV